MKNNYTLVFDKVILKQLKKVSKKKNIKNILSKMLDKIELLGVLSGKLIDLKFNIYEIKNKHPPLRLYFKEKDNEIYILKFEIKTSKKKQQRTINKIRSILEFKIFSCEFIFFNVLFKFYKSFLKFNIFC